MYSFYDAAAKVIYVGKAKNLHQRVSSYFHTNLGEKTRLMMTKAKYISFIQVESELEALLLEAKLINKLKPFYNLISKDDKSPYYIHVTDKPAINHTPSNIGPFLNRLIPLKILKLFRKVAPYCTAPKSQKTPCLYSHLGLCRPCPKSPDFSQADYRSNLRRLKLLLSGKFKLVKSQLIKSMKTYSASQNYEKAAEVKSQLQALDMLLHRPIMPQDYLLDPNLDADKHQNSLDALKDVLQPYFTDLKLDRIETYDIANLAGKDATAAMTVALNGQVDSQNFRHFKIKTVNSPNDPAMLAEVISRRLLHSDWPKPDLIVLDGGKPQLSAIDIQIPFISLAKKQEIIYIKNNSSFVEIKLEKHNLGLRLLQKLRDEAHRFSRRLHHKLRSKHHF